MRRPVNAIPFPSPPLTDAGLVLRPFELSDFASARSAREDHVTAMCVNPLADATAEAMRGSLETARQSGRFLYLVAASPDTDAYLGEILLFRRTDEVAEVAIGEVAYVVAPTARGRGLATAAVRMVSRWALGDLGLARLQISVHPDNTPSLRVAERAGYVREGMVRSLKLIRGVRIDAVRYSLLPGDVDDSRAG